MNLQDKLKIFEVIHVDETFRQEAQAADPRQNLINRIELCHRLIEADPRTAALRLTHEREVLKMTRARRLAAWRPEDIMLGPQTVPGRGWAKRQRRYEPWGDAPGTAVIVVVVAGLAFAGLVFGAVVLLVGRGGL